MPWRRHLTYCPCRQAWNWRIHFLTSSACWSRKRVLTGLVVAGTASLANRPSQSLLLRPRQWSPNPSSFQGAQPSGVQTGQATTPSEWNTDFELAVDFEINRPRGGGYRRPYIAVWVEGKNRYPVRTLLLFVRKTAPGPRWYRDLHRWYRHDQQRKSVDGMDLVDAVASATRPPGKYQVVWDGKDYHGNYVDAGSYTILIEAARENGTYQLMRERMELSGKPVKVKLDGNAEIKSAVLDYRTRNKND